ncbi:hypothetical protein ERO13_D08G114308v2 [Gossypium hirsutum]|nr:hypothetical protein ERO13_D08G114308v2 [Gossypium hirsutum]
MGFLQSPRSMNQNSKNYISGIVKRRNLSEFDMSKLGIGFDDEKSERKTSEKDKSKWFGDLPWEESLRDAHEFGKLVLF